MEDFEFVDALTGDTIIQDAQTGALSVRRAVGAAPECKSLFFPGCSMINYAMPLVSAVYDTLRQHGEADGISLLCCGKILSYEEGGDELRATFEDQLRDHVAATDIERVICACPNCMKAMRDAFAADERTASIELVTLPERLAALGYRVDPATAARIIKEDEDAKVLLCIHDSCPDRDYGEYARGIRDIIPKELWVDPEHNRSKSVCCGSLPRAAGKIEAADRCADINGREALAVSADAIATACMSCAFQLNMAQSHLHAYHFLELLYDWPIWWPGVGSWMKVRFLFDDIMGATELDRESGRAFAALGASGGTDAEPDASADGDVAISNAGTEEISL